jgi:4-hydroxybenzoate polyprenyltransferase
MRPRMSQPVCRTERSSRNALVRLMAQAEEFLRLYQTGFVAMWPVLGHATTDRWSIRTVVAVVCVSCWFNIFGGLLNDVCDLHSDRADPSRSDRWLVNGTVSVRCALAIVGLQLPLLLITHALSGFPPSSLGWLALAVVGQAAYDVFGKRSAVPPLAEAGEAMAAGCLTLYGAAVAGVPNTWTWMVAAFGAAFIMVANGFHGGLRDIEADLQARVRTTPIWLGCTAGDGGALQISASMTCYTACWLAAMGALAMAMAIRSGAAALVGTATTVLASLVTFAALHRARQPDWSLYLRAHVAMVAVPAIVALAPQLGPRRLAVLMVIYCAPIAPNTIRVLSRSRRSRADRTAADRGWRRLQGVGTRAGIAAGEDSPPRAIPTHFDLGHFMKEHR